ncbi:MAG: hypothetical protein KAR38_16280, partial [Calditrichia bacterium]|nr:hypothetical protein [Calditrichia bacterium]
MVNSSLHSQSKQEQKEFNLALRDYVAKKIATHGDYLINQEKFILSLMGLTNEEMRARVGNVVDARKKFLKSLDNSKEQLLKIKARLHSQGKHDLDVFILELERKIQKSIDSKVIDFKKKHIYEDGIQLLQVAEDLSMSDQSTISAENANSQYQKTRARLEKSFEKAGKKSTGPKILKEVTIYDLYKEWLSLKLTNYQTKYMKVIYY